MNNMIVPTRRGLIGSLIVFVAAPAIVRVQNIMPIAVADVDLDEFYPVGGMGGFTAEEIQRIAAASLDYYMGVRRR